ncbi:MAG TPA: histidine--tRNA ligase [Burkholderiales bacterium]|nr:histidine--tRNA ligase [Burkholderiales bacterium]
MATKIQAVRGMNDILPEQALLWEHFEDIARDWLRAYGYRPLRTPVLERTELFVRSIGAATDIVEKEMYTFTDALNDESLTLRPEGTASCVRATIEHNLIYNGPQRVYYTGPMFRHERPQKGRYRQFHQIGVEALGFAGPDLDAEHIVMCARLWRRLGIGDAALEVNTLGDAPARAAYRTRLIAYFEQNADLLDEDARRRMYSNPLRVLDSKNPKMHGLIAMAPKLEDDLDEASLKHFDDVQALLRENGVEFTVNPRLVRGLDYYNRTVFEWKTSRLGAQDTICAGGRYDGLIEQIGGRPAPACGFALGVERVLELMRNGAQPAPDVPLDVYIAHQGRDAAHFAFSTAERLRDRGCRVALDNGETSFASQTKRAAASGARFVAFIGDGEAKLRQMGIRSLWGDGKLLQGGGEQKQYAVEDAAELIISGRQRK